MSEGAENTGAGAGDEARQAGRGVIYIALAKLYFMIAGAVIEFRLPAVLTNTVFGAYGVVASAVSPINNVLITGTIQSVSRFTAQTPERARALQAAGFRMHLYVGLPVAALFIGLSPVLAWFLQDDTKTGPLMLAGLIIAGYSMYAVFVGTANGMRLFHKQALLDVCMATLRAAGILGLAMAGFGLYGAVSGWVAAVGVILFLASLVVGWPRVQGERESIKPMLTFFASVAVYLVLMNLVMFVDQMLLKRLSTDWFVATIPTAKQALAQVTPDWVYQIVQDGILPERASDVQVGYYRAVQNLARLSYQAIIAATFVIFPLVSRSTFESERDTTRRYIRVTFRYSLIFASAIAVVLAANPRDLLDIPYAADYASNGARALIALALGNVAFSIFVISGTILNGAGRTRAAILSAVVTLALAAVANAVVIPRVDPGPDLLLACAVATGGAMLVGAILAGVILLRSFNAFIPAATFVRVIIAGGAAMAVGHVVVVSSPLMILAEAAIVGLTFFVALIAMRELTGADLGAFTSVLRKEKTK